MMVGLSLMNSLVVQDERQPAEHQHDDRGDHRHDRDVARQRIGHARARSAPPTMKTPVAAKMPNALDWR